MLITDYQAYGTLGRRLVDRQKEVRIHGREYRVRAQVSTIGGLSAHGDKADLSKWYSSFAAQGPSPPVYLVHGDPDAGVALSKRLRLDHNASVHHATPGMKIEL